MNERIISAIVFLLALVNQVSAEDKMTISDFVISAGETKELSITLENEVTYAAFQFDLYLPEGLTVSEYSKDETRIPETTVLSMAKQKDGSFRFIASAMKANPIVGISGGIVTIKVTANEDLTSGSLTGYFKKVKLSKSDGTGSTYAEMSFPITVLEPPVMEGDANDDEEVDAKDIVDIVNHMMSKPTSTGKFNEKAADVNKDGVVNIADVVKIANIIMEK